MIDPSGQSQDAQGAAVPSEPADRSDSGRSDLRRALIVGGLFALFPLLFFGFFLFAIGGVQKNPGALGFFGVFIVFSMLMMGGFAAVIALVIPTMARRMSGKHLGDVFEPFAQHVSGRVETPPPRFWGLHRLPPSVSFQHGGIPAVLRIEVVGSGKNRIVYTVLEFTLAESSPVDLRITPQGFFHSLGKWLGMQDIEVGDAAFDERFVVQTSRDSAAATFLNPAVRQALLEMSDWRRQTPTQLLGSTSHIDLALRGQSFKLRTLGFLNKAEFAIRFYEHAGRVLDSMFAPGASSSPSAG
jgi:hypothetical protein